MFVRFVFVVMGAVNAGCAGELPERGLDQGATDATIVVLVDGATADGDARRPPDGAPADAAPAQDAAGPAADRSLPPPDRQVWPYDGSFGKPCSGWQDCPSPLICAGNTHTGATFCTSSCDPCAADPCPSGTGCQNAGITYICAPGYPDAPCP